MAKATIIKIADAVVDQLNGRSWSQTFVAQRHYIPRYEPEDLDTLHVSVVPAPDGILVSGSTRSDNQEDYNIDIAVQIKFAEDTNEAVDPYVLLLEEIADHFVKEILLIDPKTIVPPSGVEYRPVWAPEHHRGTYIYTGVVRLTCRCWR